MKLNKSQKRALELTKVSVHDDYSGLSIFYGVDENDMVVLSKDTDRMGIGIVSDDESILRGIALHTLDAHKDKKNIRVILVGDERFYLGETKFADRFLSLTSMSSISKVVRNLHSKKQSPDISHVVLLVGVLPSLCDDTLFKLGEIIFTQEAFPHITPITLFTQIPEGLGRYAIFQKTVHDDYDFTINGVLVNMFQA